jgi:hypothetical protein
VQDCQLLTALPAVVVQPARLEDIPPRGTHAD